jgi:XRE family aerobic/anaerobic benzoate catabolism transcriptional regulator
MSSTIIHVSGKTPASGSAPSLDEKDPFLVSLGERVRKLRARRGMTRKVTADNAGISERHLANLEHGVGNASI